MHHACRGQHLEIAKLLLEHMSRDAALALNKVVSKLTHYIICFLRMLTDDRQTRFPTYRTASPRLRFGVNPQEEEQRREEEEEEEEEMKRRLWQHISRLCSVETKSST